MLSLAKPAKMAVHPPPFFILGCVRSGTTMLRNVLREHPNLACPEETHFFRWASPFGTIDYTRAVTESPVLKKHRAMDGVSEEEFQSLLKTSRSRQQLMRRYMELFVSRKKPSANRWFDKTPQNVYGAALLLDAFPGAKIVHIVRNPCDVVASLKIGRLIKVDDIVGASNYWNEAVSIVNVLRRTNSARVHEVRYEDYVLEPERCTNEILTFVGENPANGMYSYQKISAKSHQDDGTLTPENVELVKRLCRRWGVHYGYFSKEVAAASMVTTQPQ